MASFKYWYYSNTLMQVRTIKNVDKETWNKLKTIADTNKISMGKLLEKMINEYKNTSKEFWSEVLSEKKIISDEEARALRKQVLLVRKEYGFR